MLFDHVGELDAHLTPPGRTGMVDCADAAAHYYDPLRDPRRALSETCVELDCFFRERYVKRLFVRPRAEAGWQSLVRSLGRYPGAKVVEVIAPAVGGREMRRSARAFARGVKVERSKVGAVIVMEALEMRAMDAEVLFGEVLVAVEELQLSSDRHGLTGFAPLIAGVEIRKWLWSVPEKLRSLSLCGMGWALRDLDGAALRRLTALKRLDLVQCFGMRRKTFVVVAGLTTLEELRLEMEECEAPLAGLNEDDGVALYADLGAVKAMLGKLALLKTFFLCLPRKGGNQCLVDESLIGALPAALDKLHISVKFRSPLSKAAFSRLRDLTYLSVSTSGLGGWQSFLGLPSSLETLCVHDRTLNDDGAADVFAEHALRDLRGLDISGCVMTSGSFASVIADMPKLARLTLVGLDSWADGRLSTAMTGTGAARNRKLTYLNISGCSMAGLESCASAAGLQHVEELQMARTRITLEGVNFIVGEGACPRLRSLSLSLLQTCMTGECDAATALLDRLKERPSFQCLHLTHFCAVNFFTRFIENMMF